VPNHRRLLKFEGHQTTLVAQLGSPIDSITSRDGVSLKPLKGDADDPEAEAENIQCETRIFPDHVAGVAMTATVQLRGMERTTTVMECVMEN
jgi:hypothetical protein